ncbi:MAG TPA: hypothetical protein VFT92_05650 [Nitrospira sp.]|nr:hypothetical protein [Nitrospira sp.]
MAACHAALIPPVRLFFFIGLLAALSACSLFGIHKRHEVAFNQRLALLPARLDFTIDKASQVETLPDGLSSEEVKERAPAALEAVRSEARRMFFEKLETGDQFRLVPLEEVDRAVQAIALPNDKEIITAQLTELRDRLKADVIVQPTVLDYGKVRWYWLAGGMLADISWETVAIGLASSWNPGIILGNVGFELLTSTPVWFGGGYLFGIVARPVRVQADAWDPINGESVWEKEEFAVYIWGRLNQLPEPEREKKEAQLYLNLKESMEELAGSLLDEGLTISELEKRRRPPPVPESY